MSSQDKPDAGAQDTAPKSCAEHFLEMAKKALGHGSTKGVATPAKPVAKSNCKTIQQIMADKEAKKAAYEAARKATEEELKVKAPSMREALAKCYGATKAKHLAHPFTPYDELIDEDIKEHFRPKRGKGARLVSLGRHTGPLRLFHLLHFLAIYTAVIRNHHRATSQVTFHTSQELLALSLGVCTKTVQRWTDALMKKGLVDCSEHYGCSVDKETGEKRTLITGLVYAVTLRRKHQARLHYEDLHYDYRQLDEDREAGRTAYQYMQQLRNRMLDERRNMSESLNFSEDSVGIHCLKAWAVTPGGGKEAITRYSNDSDIFDEGQKGKPKEVIYNLVAIENIHNADRRRLAVDQVSRALAHILNDQHSQRWYARLIWNALEGQLAGLRSLQLLAAYLERLLGDVEEWRDLKRPGALLAVRLRPQAA